jgi:hypothetical protein
VTWQLVLGAAAGAAVILSVIGFAFYAVSGLRDAQGKAAAERTKTDTARGELDVERRLRKLAEEQRDAALADAMHQKLIAETNKVAAKVAIEQLDAETAARLKEKVDAITSGTLVAADAQLDDLLR